MEPAPPMTASDLLALFRRYADESTAVAYVVLADIHERQSIDYFRHLVLKWVRFGVYRPR
jgi:hypothetical protein